MTLVLNEQLLTAEQAAKYLGTTPGTLAVWRCTRRHPIPYVKLGRSVRYRQSDLERYLEAQTVVPVTEAE